VKRILVGVDGSDHAAHALRWACTLAKPFDAEVVLVTAGPKNLEEKAERENWSGPAVEAGVAHRAIVRRGDAGLGLVNAAESEDADLLVVGHRPRRGVLELGSTAMFVAHFAERPFALAPAGAGAHRPERVIVGVDGSDASRGAAEWAGRVAHTLGAEVLAAYVQWPMPDLLAPLPRDMREQARHELEARWIAPIRATGASVKTALLEAVDPAEGLLGLVGTDEAAMLVIGTRRLGGLRPIRLGGVTLHLLHRADVPVVVVPASSKGPSS
jgi:nucleotide-binding universal stress UspA family protein